LEHVHSLSREVSEVKTQEEPPYFGMIRLSFILMHARAMSFKVSLCLAS
jgi:hypothetical protein